MFSGENAHEHSPSNITAVSMSSHAALHLHRLNISEKNRHFGKHEGEKKERNGKENASLGKHHPCNTQSIGQQFSRAPHIDAPIHQLSRGRM